LNKVTLEAFSNEDASLNCDNIDTERRNLTEKMNDATSRIETNRGRDQAVIYFTGALGAPFIANSNDAERQQIASLYQRQDKLIKLASVKNCATNK